jgi:hypothetical protein
MKCIYSDGLKVDYDGFLRISKADEINIFMKEGVIPRDIKGDLSVATINYNCRELRKVAESITETYGKKACIHE